VAIRGRQPKRTPSPWSHAGLERRGYRKCPYCWRHLVKLEDHVAAHRSGTIGADGRRRDRTAEERRRWAERIRRTVGGVPQAPRRFVPRDEFVRLFTHSPIDFQKFRAEIDAMASQEP
jgi:hypothetical protein